MNKIISATDLADIMGVSKSTLLKWEKNGKYTFQINSEGHKVCELSTIAEIPEIKDMILSRWKEEEKVRPLRRYSSIELFAGAGGLALGLEKAGFETVLLNEINADACSTLRFNRPKWNIVENDIKSIDFSEYYNQVDFLSGGFPCQAFSYAGNKFGFEDTRGTLFFELARAIKEVKPKVFMA